MTERQSNTDQVRRSPIEMSVLEFADRQLRDGTGTQTVGTAMTALRVSDIQRVKTLRNPRELKLSTAQPPYWQDLLAHWDRESDPNGVEILKKAHEMDAKTYPVAPEGGQMIIDHYLSLVTEGK